MRVGSFAPGEIAIDVREMAADMPETTSIVVFRDDVYVGIAGGILHLGKDGPRATHALPVGEFPAGAVVHGLRWGPDLRVYFCFAGAHAADSGVGRFDPAHGKVELYSAGLDGRAVAFDADGSPLVRHVPSGEVFPVSPGG